MQACGEDRVNFRFFIRRGPNQSARSTEALRGGVGPGLPPDLVGRCLLQAIRDQEPYILTHAGERATIQAHHDHIEAAFEHAEAWEKTR